MATMRSGSAALQRTHPDSDGAPSGSVTESSLQSSSSVSVSDYGQTADSSHICSSGSRGGRGALDDKDASRSGSGSCPPPTASSTARCWNSAGGSARKSIGVGSPELAAGAKAETACVLLLRAETAAACCAKLRGGVLPPRTGMRDGEGSAGVMTEQEEADDEQSRLGPVFQLAFAARHAPPASAAWVAHLYRCVALRAGGVRPTEK